MLRRWESIAGTLTLLRQLFYSLCWSIYVFNSVINTKLPDLCSTENERERDGNEG